MTIKTKFYFYFYTGEETNFYSFFLTEWAHVYIYRSYWKKKIKNEPFLVEIFIKTK